VLFCVSWRRGGRRLKAREMRCVPTRCWWWGMKHCLRPRPVRICSQTSSASETNNERPTFSLSVGDLSVSLNVNEIIYGPSKLGSAYSVALTSQIGPTRHKYDGWRAHTVYVITCQYILQHSKTKSNQSNQSNLIKQSRRLLFAKVSIDSPPRVLSSYR